MEVRPVWETDERVEADAACEELREHGIKCDTFEPGLGPDIQAPYQDVGVYVARYQVVVAVGDEDRASEILADWKP